MSPKQFWRDLNSKDHVPRLVIVFFLSVSLFASGLGMLALCLLGLVLNLISLMTGKNWHPGLGDTAALSIGMMTVGFCLGSITHALLDFKNGQNEKKGEG